MIFPVYVLLMQENPWILIKFNFLNYSYHWLYFLNFFKKMFPSKKTQNKRMTNPVECDQSPSMGTVVMSAQNTFDSPYLLSRLSYVSSQFPTWNFRLPLHIERILIKTTALEGFIWKQKLWRPCFPLLFKLKLLWVKILFHWQNDACYTPGILFLCQVFESASGPSIDSVQSCKKCDKIEVRWSVNFPCS